MKKVNRRDPRLAVDLGNGIDVGEGIAVAAEAVGYRLRDDCVSFLAGVDVARA